MTKCFYLAALVAMTIGLASASNAQAAINLSFTGDFTSDDDVQSFTFTTDGTSEVTLRTWSYAGGTNAAGTSIARGGFDPILALFDSSGVLLDFNDDGGTGVVGDDAVTGMPWDTFFSEVLAQGTYTVTIMQFANFPAGANLSDGFVFDGAGNFTGGPFIDNTGNQRDGHWAFDILNVVDGGINAVPEPASMVVWSVIGVAVAGGTFLRRRKSA